MLVQPFGKRGIYVMNSGDFACDCEVIHPEVLEKVNEFMPSGERLAELALFLKLFGDFTRVRIMWALSINEMCVCDLAVLLNITKSAISHQLKLLRDANLVSFRKNGKIVFYSLADEHVGSILEQSMVHISE